MTSQHWQQLALDRERWWVDPAWRDQLLNKSGLRLAEWEREGRVEVIKHSLHRTVYRIGLADRAVFLKQYPIPDVASRVKRWLRPAKALREWRKALLLNQYAVPTIRPLAVGVHPDGASSFVSEALDGAVGLHEFVEAHWSQWRRQGQWSECRDLLDELGIFLGRLYRAGIVHADLHGDNILVRIDSSGEREWFLIDPYDINSGLAWHSRFGATLARLLGRCTRQQSLQTSLALAGMAYWHDLRPADRLRCWIAFRQECGSQLQLREEEERGLLDAVDAEVMRRTRTVWSKRADRCVKANRDFYHLESKRCQAWASQALPADWLLHILRDPHGPLRESSSTILKTSQHGQVGVVQGPGGMPLLYKRFSPHHRLDRLFSFCRQSPALRCYRMAYRLDLARIPTATPLAVIEQYKRGTRKASFLVTEFIPDAVSLVEFVLRARDSEEYRVLRGLTVRLAKAVRRLHDFRISHRDMKAVNLLVRQVDGTPQPVFIDLKGVNCHRWLTRSRRQKDLARLALSARTTLNATPSDLLRFLVHYLGRERSQWRGWWRAIAHRGAKKIAQNMIRQRTVS